MPKKVADYTCYVFDWYVEHGAPLPGSAEFAQFMAQNLEAEWLSLPAGLQFDRAVEEFRKGISEAESSPGAYAKTAMETFCRLA